MDFHILGPLEVIHDGRSVTLRGSRERAVLAVLLSDANHVVSVDRIAEDLWAGTPPEGAVPAVRVFVSRLRKTLRAVVGTDVIVTEPPGYVARIAPEALDAARFEAGLTEGREHAQRADHARAARVLAEALALWRGPALVDVAEGPVVRAEAARLDEVRMTALEERLDADLACGRHAEVVAELEALTRAHPLRERLWAQRMVALYRSGRQADALRAYQEVRQILGQELGLEPGLALSRLEGAILRHEAHLDLPPPSDGHSAPAPVTFLFSDIEASTRRWEGDPAGMAKDLALHDELLRAAFEDASAARSSATPGTGCAPPSPTAAAAFGGRRGRPAGARGSELVRARPDPGAHGDPHRRGRAPGGQLLRPAAQPRRPSAGGWRWRPGALLAGGRRPGRQRPRSGAEPARPRRAPAGRPRPAGTGIPDERTPGCRRRSPPCAPRARGPAQPPDSAHRLRRSGCRARRRATAPRPALAWSPSPASAAPGRPAWPWRRRAAALDRYPDGVWLVELAAAARRRRWSRRTVAVPSAALGHRAGRARRRPGARCAPICARSGRLLVLDNCEHLIDAARRLASTPCWRGCPDLTVLATSREALGPAGRDGLAGATAVPAPATPAGAWPISPGPTRWRCSASGRGRPDPASS